MTIKLFRLIGVLLLICVCFVSCEKETPCDDYNKEVITVGRAMGRLTRLKVSDLGKSVRYVVLETTPKSAIGSLPRVRMTNDFLFVSSRGENIKMFDRQTGKYLRTIGNLQDSLEVYENTYGMISFWIDESRQTLYCEGRRGELIAYDFGGNFQRRFHLPDSVYTDNSELICYNIRHDTIDAYSRSRFNYRPFRLYRLDDRDSIARKYRTRYNPPPSGWTRRAEFDELVLGTYGKFGGHYRRIGYDKRSFFFIKDVPMLWTHDTLTRFKEDFVNTIHTITNEGLQPYLTFDLGKWDWPFDERYLIHLCVHRIAIDYVLEGKGSLYFHFHEGLYGYGTFRKTFCGVFNKQTGYTKVMRGDTIENDLTRLMPFTLQGASSRGDYCAVIEAFKIKPLLEKLPSDISFDTLNPFLKLTDDDNPVVVIVE